MITVNFCHLQAVTLDWRTQRKGFYFALAADGFQVDKAVNYH